MSKRYPRAKWVLPDVIDPPDRICFQIEVPNNQQHLAAFRGALYNLSSAIFWADDLDHTAKEVAAVWDEILQNVKPCPPGESNTGINLEDFMSQTIRKKPEDGCIIQMWCIDHWEDWYDPRPCVPGSAGQPGGGGELPAGECRNYQALLEGNSQWLLPVPVEAGDTIRISNATGGWSQGGINAWKCPNGGNYTLGICGAPGGGAGVGFPVPTLPAGRLIALIDGVYYDAYDTTIPVPTGVASSDVFFQMNDTDITNNFGSVAFDIEVCKSNSSNVVTITYLTGSGPLQVSYGEEFVCNFAAAGLCSGLNHYELTFTADKCFDLEIVSLINWSSQTAAPCNAPADGLKNACGGGGFSGNWTDPATTTFINQDGFNINNMTAGGTVILKLTAP